jgi:hypothetical protein
MINLKTKGSPEHAITHLVHALFGIKPVCFGGKKIIHIHIIRQCLVVSANLDFQSMEKNNRQFNDYPCTISIQSIF